MAEASVITDESDLRALVERLLGEPRYGLDTEFHRERTYFPKLALVQVAWPGGLALIDPLAVDLAPFAEVLDGPGQVVMHAASQDLEVLELACGTVPSSLFDTQLAAGFLGFSTPSLGLLVERVVGVVLPKAGRLTDWLARPLRADQLTYAAADVAHLLELTAALESELTASGRLDWAAEECEQLRARARQRPDPDEAWLRLKDTRNLRGPARGVAQAVAAWRDRRAATTDQPVRFVLPDLAVIGIANHPPRDVDDLRRVRGIEERYLRKGAAAEILAAVEQGRAMPDDAIREPKREEVGRDLRPAVALVAAWVGQLSRHLRIDAALLATRADLVALTGGDPDGRLAGGWRAELLGEPIRQLVDGHAALAFDGAGGVVLEERSGRRVQVDLPLPTAPWAR